VYREGWHTCGYGSSRDTGCSTFGSESTAKEELAMETRTGEVRTGVADRLRCLFRAIVLLGFGMCLSVCSDARGAGLLIADGGFGGVLEIVEHTVNVTINNGIAVTEVNQVFRNKENRIAASEAYAKFLDTYLKTPKE